MSSNDPKYNEIASESPEVAHSTEQRVKVANRLVYNRKTVDEYDSNESIFNTIQERRLLEILEEVRDRAPSDEFLDVGCGTGNLLRLADRVFDHAFGVDQAEQLLAQVAERNEFSTLAAASADRLPFASDSFGAVGMYALLHHLYDPTDALAEAYRVLRPGGVLYTDHDPNYYFGRIYHTLHRLGRGRRPGFGTELEDLAEYHNCHTSGLDPEELKAILTSVGFSEVEVRYRHSTNPSFEGLQAIVASTLKRMSQVMPLKSLYTHFMIFATK